MSIDTYKIIPERDIIWAAGLIDGEGSIYVKRANGTKNVIHSLDVEVSMCDRPTIERLHAIFGLGSFRPAKRKKKKACHRQAWKWVASSNQAAIVLQLILPYLVTKKEEALLGLEFTALKSVRVGRAGLSEEVVEERERLYWELKELKKVEYEMYE